VQRAPGAFRDRRIAADDGHCSEVELGTGQYEAEREAIVNIGAWEAVAGIAIKDNAHGNRQPIQLERQA
jgi:hypothetical protein